VSGHRRCSLASAVNQYIHIRTTEEWKKRVRSRQTFRSAYPFPQSSASPPRLWSTIVSMEQNNPGNTRSALRTERRAGEARELTYDPPIDPFCSNWPLHLMLGAIVSERSISRQLASCLSSSYTALFGPTARVHYELAGRGLQASWQSQSWR
jgi:hypothetical protein